MIFKVSLNKLKKNYLILIKRSIVKREIYYLMIIFSTFVFNNYSSQSLFNAKFEKIKKYIFTMYELNNTEELSKGLAEETLKKSPQLNNFENLQSDIKTILDDSLLSEAINITMIIDLLLTQQLSNTDVALLNLKRKVPSSHSARFLEIKKIITDYFDPEVDKICDIIIEKIKHKKVNTN